MGYKRHKTTRMYVRNDIIKAIKGPILTYFSKGNPALNHMDTDINDIMNLMVTHILGGDR